MGVHDGALDVSWLGVVRERTLYQTLLLAQPRDAGFVIVLEYLLAKNSVCNLRLPHHQVAFKHACLQWTIRLGALTFQRI